MMNYYRNMDRTELQIDFASSNDLEPELAKELYQNNSSYFNLGSRQKSPVCYMRNLGKLLRAGHYDVIHVNGNSATMAADVFLAKICGIPHRIAHTHNTMTEHPFWHRLLYPMLPCFGNENIAVSTQSGDWLYGKHGYTVLNNAIPTEKYRYDEKVRKQYRNLFHVEGKFVIGSVGRLNRQKNHQYLLHIFARLREQAEDSVLLLVGGGDLEREIKKQADRLGIAEDVIFTGTRKDVEHLLQAMDFFVFPSIFEGLGMVLIEAQASGLYCLCSDVVPQETRVSENIEYMSLSEKPEEWAQRILEIKTTLSGDRERISAQAVSTIKRSGYDITLEAEKLRKLYCSKVDSGEA